MKTLDYPEGFIGPASRAKAIAQYKYREPTDTWISEKMQKFVSDLYTNKEKIYGLPEYRIFSTQIIPQKPGILLRALPYLASDKMFKDLDMNYLKDPKVCSDCGWELHVNAMKRWAKNGYNLTEEDVEKIYNKWLKWKLL